MNSDKPSHLNYRDLMVEGTAFIKVKIETSQPIEMNDFIGAFASIGSEFDRLIKQNHPDLVGEAKIYVSQVQHGSIIAELIPYAMTILQTADYALITDQFIRRVDSIIRSYQTPDARLENITKSELQDVMEGMAAIANDPNGRTDIQSFVIEGGETKVRAAMHFTTNQARAAMDNMRDHVRLIEHHENLNRGMVLMTFFQSNLKDAELQTRSGEQVIIQAISPKPRPLVYASELARDRIKHEISDSEDNIYRKGFYVDVIVDMVGEKIAAYKVTNFHQVIDLPN